MIKGSEEPLLEETERQMMGSMQRQTLDWGSHVFMDLALGFPFKMAWTWTLLVFHCTWFWTAFVWLGLKLYPQKKKMTERSKNKQNVITCSAMIFSHAGFHGGPRPEAEGCVCNILHAVALNFAFIATKRFKFEPLQNSLSTYFWPHSVRNGAIDE